MIIYSRICQTQNLGVDPLAMIIYTALIYFALLLVALHVLVTVRGEPTAGVIVFNGGVNGSSRVGEPAPHDAYACIWVRLPKGATSGSDVFFGK